MFHLGVLWTHNLFINLIVLYTCKIVCLLENLRKMRGQENRRKIKNGFKYFIIHKN